MATGCSFTKGAAEIRAVLSDISLHCIMALIHSEAVAVQLSPVAHVEQFI